MVWNRRQLSPDFSSFGDIILQLGTGSITATLLVNVLAKQLVDLFFEESAKHISMQGFKSFLSYILEDQKEVAIDQACKEALVISIFSKFEELLIEHRYDKVISSTPPNMENRVFVDGCEVYVDALSVDWKDPLSNPLATEIINLAAHRLREAKVPEKKIAVILTSIRLYVPMLFWELIQNENRYKKFKDHFDTQAWKAGNELFLYLKHRAEIAGYFTKPMELDGIESLTLEDIYVKPYFWMHLKCWPENVRKLIQENDDLKVHRRANSEDVTNFVHPCSFENEKAINAQMHLHQFLDAWVRGETALSGCKDNPLLLLLGQPGQGKSSCCMRLVHDFALDVERIYFVRLRETDIFKHTDAPLQYLNDYVFRKLFKQNGGQPLEDRTALLILDGLDEASLNQQASSSKAVSLIKSLSHMLRRDGNTGQFAKLRIILSSRTAMLSPDCLTFSDALTLHLAPFSQDQQILWSSKLSPHLPFSPLTPKTIKDIHLSKEDNPILELIEQPVILMLIATANINLTAVNSRHALYDKLFDELINRRLGADQGGIHPEMRLTADNEKRRTQFRRTIAEIGLACFLDGRGCTTEKNALFIIKQFEAEDLFDISSKDDEKIKEALSKLMISFYLTNSGESSKQTLEFFHRTLMEYLAVEAVVEYLKEFSQKSHSGNEDAFLGLMFLLFGQPLWSDQMGVDLEYHIKALTNDERSKIESMLLAHAIYLIENEFMPRSIPELAEVIKWQEFSEDMYFETAWLEASCTSLLFYLALLELTSKPITDNSKPMSSGKYEFNKLLLTTEEPDVKYIFHTHVKIAASYILQAPFRKYSLPYLNLEDIEFIGSDFSNVDFSGANMSRVNLSHANLSGADLTGAKLHEASMLGTDLSGSSLFRADLSEADLSGSDLSEADLSEADLSGTNLSDADMSDSIIIFIDMDAQEDCSEIKYKKQYKITYDSITNRSDSPLNPPASFKEHIAHWRGEYGLTPVPPESAP